jgi:hypothetical protein
MSLLDTRPTEVDLDSLLDADIGVIRWLRADERLYIIGERNRRTIQKPRPQYIAPEEPGVLYTHYQTGTARPAVQIDPTDFDTRSREDVAASVQPQDGATLYIPQFPGRA